MRSLRAVRGSVRVVIAVAALGAVAGAHATTFPIYLENRPALATGAGETVVAWSSNGVVQTASRNPDGSFTPGSAVGRTLGSHSPLLAITPTGEQIVVWQSGRALRSAVRPTGRGSWKLETVAPNLQRLFPQAQLLVDPAGRALLVWVSPGGAGDYPVIWQSMRLPGGSWGAPTRPAGLVGVSAISTAMESTGDVVIVFYANLEPGGTRVVIEAVTLPFGASEWSAPVVISGSDRFANGPVLAAGGGGRTFIASWRVANPGGTQRSEPDFLTRTSRVRLPAAWQAPSTLVPGATAATPGAYGLLKAQAVDAQGNALAILRWDTGRGGTALSALRLPASADGWTAPVAVDVPEGRQFDSPPALSLAEDGSATVTTLHIGLAGNTLRLATAPAGSDAWQGEQADAIGAPSCSADLPLWNPGRCPIYAETTPVVDARGPVSAVVIQELDVGASVVVLSRGPGRKLGRVATARLGRPDPGRRAPGAGPQGRRADRRDVHHPSLQRRRGAEDERRPRTHPCPSPVSRARKQATRIARSSCRPGSGPGWHTAGSSGRTSPSACTRATARASRRGFPSCSPGEPGSR